MPQIIDKASLGHLAKLARLKLTAKENQIFLKDLQKILNYFNQLQAISTDEIEPMTGGTVQKNILREDEVNIERKPHSVNDVGRIVEAFPETDKGYLKVPKVL